MSDIELKVNGEEIPLSDFPAEIITEAILGMLKVLNGVDDIDEVEININNK